MMERAGLELSDLNVSTRWAPLPLTTQPEITEVTNPDLPPVPSRPTYPVDPNNPFFVPYHALVNNTDLPSIVNILVDLFMADTSGGTKMDRTDDPDVEVIETKKEAKVKTGMSVLRQENADLREENARLREENARLRGNLARVTEGERRGVGAG